jgi:chemotaxis family two-component system response regulator Rcp1
MESAILLLVEDNPGDIRLTKEALKGAKIDIHLHVVQDGRQAMDFLQRNGTYSDAPRPDLILLDLNLPRMDGRQVLQGIKSDEDLRRLPVVILTTSDAESDILTSYDLHANCYITKPIDLHRFIDIVHSIQDFWLSTVRLPPK